MANATTQLYAARMQFMVTKPNALFPVLTGPIDMSFQVRKSKPRSVADIRYMGLVGIEGVMRAHDRFYRKRGLPPDTIRVTRETRDALRKQADRGIDDKPSKNLTVYGIKVTL